MLSRTISIYLAAAIVVCPYFCKRGNASPDTQRAEVHSCCGCSHTPRPSRSTEEHPSLPDPSGEHSDRCCQCICGGAVVEDALALDIVFDVNWAVPPPLVPSFVVQTQDELLNRITAAPPPDDGSMNPGRVLRRRLMSFLC